MSIEIYDKAKIVKKDGRYHYFVKNGSKNSFTCGGQTIKDNNFRNKFIKHQTRDSDWHMIAHGDSEAFETDKIADTEWNCPTSNVYGQIRFGNKLNIALYFAKNKSKVLDYDKLDDIQKSNISSLINYALRDDNKEWTIDLSDIPENKRHKEIVNYCGKEFRRFQNYTDYGEKIYWLLDNL
jgi:hypothetical protein